MYHKYFIVPAERSQIFTYYTSGTTTLTFTLKKDFISRQSPFRLSLENSVPANGTPTT